MNERRKRMSKNIQEYTDPDAMLTELNARSHGKYFLCTCPQCQQQEAYMYKTNMNVIFCNRQNECGETTRVLYTEKESTEALKENYGKKSTSKKWLSKQEKEELRVLTANMRYFTDELGSFDIDKGKNYRGISRGVYQSHLLITPDLEFGTRLLDTFPGIMRRYGRSEESRQRFENRDVVIPFYDEKGQVDRLLLRSTSPDVVYSKEYPKELHCIVQYQKDEVKNYQHNINYSQDSPILITESLLNALSVKELDHDVEFIAATGVNHVRQMQAYIQSNSALFKERGAILAFDPDKAGVKAQEKLHALFEKQEIPFEDFPYPDTERDLNDLLQDDPQIFREIWEKVQNECQERVNEPERVLNLAYDEMASFLMNEYEGNVESFEEAKIAILEEVKEKNKVSLAYTDFSFEGQEEEYDIQVSLDLNSMELIQEVSAQHGNYTIVAKQFESERDLLDSAKNFDFAELTSVSEELLQEKMKEKNRQPIFYNNPSLSQDGR